jgi:hypothetical protein
VASQRASINERLKAFAVDERSIELDVSGAILSEYAKQIIEPLPGMVDVRTSKTSGIITNADILHNDKVLGNVGLEVRLDGDDFGTGTLTVSPQSPNWSHSGLSLVTALAAKASVKLDLHLGTGIDGGIGTKVSLNADGGTTVPLSASIEKKSLAQGRAIIIQPTVPCSPARISVHPGASPPFTEAWMTVSPVGLEFDVELGGMRIIPKPGERDSG